jgi:electron transfer flavoprotein beta subunit
MLENTNEMRFAGMDDMLRAARFDVRKWNKDLAGIEDAGKIGLKGSPTVVSKVFGAKARTEKADVEAIESSTPRDAALNLIQKIFTRNPALEREMVERTLAWDVR